MPLSVVAQSFELYKQLAASGAPQLALDGLRQDGPELALDPSAWVNWQTAELELLSEQQWWQQLLDQIDGYSDTVPAGFIANIQKMRIAALIELNRFNEARHQLIRQIWEANSEELAAEELKLWRGLIVKSYIAEGMSDDAYISMQHFRHDYGIEDESATELLIHTLLVSNFPAVAEGVIDKLPDSDEKMLLKQLARLRQGKGVRSIQFSAKERLHQKGLSAYKHLMLWAMVAEAAEQRSDIASRVIALEALLRRDRNKKVEALFDLDAQQLWKAYDAYAQSVANREQLLLGDDSTWIESAQKAGKMHPIHQRSIYAYLTRHAISKAGRIVAQDLMVAAIKKLDNGEALITSLYSSNGGDIQAEQFELGQQVLSVLLDNALKARDLERASVLISRMDTPEVGNGHFVWLLRKAKILMLANNSVQAIEVMERLVKELPGTSEKNRDRLIQLIFDLQTAHQDVAAIRLLQVIDSQSNDAKLHRELLYWIADSNMSLEQYRLAAQGYLQSAIVPGINTMDPWAQTARYQAAKALLKAELKGDAKAIYEQLLKHTKNSSRRALLKQELEQIHLH